MKRPRNVDCGKIRRPLKRSKITDGIYGSTFLYLRFLLVWALLLMADFILEFRFEYLWPFWLLLRSVYDSFKYQGLAFSVFFVCIAITSDVICYLFIPVQWLFFAASTYVWVQYVWHTERGICLPTVSLWLLFVYIEASIRLRELKSLPFNLDLCRPFACHCIGYPVVTLGFGFKSYVSYKMKLRRQKVIQKVNDSYLQILQQALPEDVRYPEKVKPLPAPPEENGSQKPSKEGKDDGKDVNEDDDNSFMQKSLPNKSLNNENDANSENIPSETPPSKIKQPATNGIVSSPPPPLQPKVSNIGQKNNTNNSQHKKGKGSRIEASQPTPSPLPFTNNKEEVIHRLETDVKKLKADLQSSRNCEQELKSQINSYSSDEKVLRSEIYQLQQDNCNLENKLHNLVTSRQQDKASLAGLEKRLAEEKKVKATLEQQLLAERKRSNAEQQATQRALSLAAATRNECTESCKSRRRDMDTELKQLRRDSKVKDDQNRQLEREVVALRQYKDTAKETEVLMKALATMQDKNSELEKNLNAETRFKQDLFSALGKERNEIKILQTSVAEKDGEILDLKSKIAEVMALIPSPAVTSHYGHTEQRNSSPLFCPASLELHYSPPPPPPQPANPGLANPGLGNHGSHANSEPGMAPASDLNPNATDYTPKSAI